MRLPHGPCGAGRRAAPSPRGPFALASRLAALRAPRRPARRPARHVVARAGTPAARGSPPRPLKPLRPSPAPLTSLVTPLVTPFVPFASLTLPLLPPLAHQHPHRAHQIRRLE